MRTMNFSEFFWAFTMRHFQSKSPWMTKGLVKSSKMKQNLYEKFLKFLNHKQYKTYSEYLKKKSKRSIHTNIISKNVGCYERNYWKQKSH